MYSLSVDMKPSLTPKAVLVDQADYVIRSVDATRLICISYQLAWGLDP